MAKLLIINPNTDNFGRQSIPTGLITALLKKHNHQVELFDTTFLDIHHLYLKDKTHEEMFRKFHVFKKVDYSSLNLEKKKDDVIRIFEEKLISYQPDLIAFSFWGSHLHAEGEFHAYFHALKIVELANTREIPIVVGGTVPTWNSEEVLKHPKINYVIRGEGELAYLDLMEHLANKESVEKIPNLWTENKKGEIVKNEFRPLIDPLDQLPHADFDIYDDRTFYRPFHGKMVRCIDYELSRGCVYQCTFCLSVFQRENYGSPKNFRREKSIKKIVDEISFLKERYKLDVIRFQDETFLTMKKDKLKELSKFYKKHVDLPFIIEATINSITEEKIEYLKEMGCISIGFGLESGSEDLRKEVIKKPPFTNKQALTNLKIVKNNGIAFTIYNIIGFPEETREMIEETIEVNYAVNPPFSLVSYFQPWEGTKLRDTAIAQGLLDSESKGLDNSSDSQYGTSLKNLKVSPEILKHYHDSFTYYVYINKIFWPLIDKYVGKKGHLAKLVTSFLTMILNIRFKLIS